MPGFPSKTEDVTTCVVVWIEIMYAVAPSFTDYVTTCVVVWIEIKMMEAIDLHITSPPAWWCGLKSMELVIAVKNVLVTTCVVVWIEI